MNKGVLVTNCNYTIKYWVMLTDVLALWLKSEFALGLACNLAAGSYASFNCTHIISTGNM